MKTPYTATEVAKLMNISLATVQRYCREGAYPNTRPGKFLLIERKFIDELVLSKLDTVDISYLWSKTGVLPTSISLMLRKGSIKGRKIGGAWHIKNDVAQKFIEKFGSSWTVVDELTRESPPKAEAKPPRPAPPPGRISADEYNRHRRPWAKQLPYSITAVCAEARERQERANEIEKEWVVMR